MAESHICTLDWIRLEEITAGIQSRTPRESGIQRLIESIERSGFLPQYPLAVSEIDEGYRVLAGHHRLEAARRLGLETAPALIYSALTANEEWRVAVETNRAHEAATLPTFVDDAELVWKLIETGRKQEEVAGIMGWSRAQVSQYAMLKQISLEAWKLIATTFEIAGSTQQDDSVAEMLPVVASHQSIFNERILRDITPLTSAQQLTLVKLLLKDPKAKTEYRKQAERYRARNALTDEARRLLKLLPPEFLERALVEVEKGAYDGEWQTQKMPGERFQKLIQQILDEHAQKQNYTLHYGRFEDMLETNIPDESLDVIITDPPYGKDALPLYDLLAAWAARRLKAGGRLFVMTGQRYGYEVQTALRKTLTFCWEFCYSTPGGQAVQIWGREVNTFWKPIYWFEKGDHHETRWMGDVVKSAVNDNDKRYHEWGQSESGMEDLIKRVTEPGDVVCDPFMGAGTTGIAALRHGRKFIGIEADPDTFEHATQRFREEAQRQEGA